jgi:hypothetical protein
VYADRWSPGLRQGDVLGKVPFPLAKSGFRGLPDVGGLSGTGAGAPTQFLIEGNPRYVMVVSHDCEFNEGKRTHFTVARIDSIDARTSDDELDILRLGNDVQRAAEEGKTIALDTFFLEPLRGAFDQPHRVNFATLVSIPMQLKSEAVKLKKAELEHAVRILLRRKLTFFFGRDADDIPDEAKRDRPQAEEGAEPQAE